MFGGCRIVVALILANVVKNDQNIVSAMEFYSSNTERSGVKDILKVSTRPFLIPFNLDSSEIKRTKRAVDNGRADPWGPNALQPREAEEWRLTKKRTETLLNVISKLRDTVETTKEQVTSDINTLKDYIDENLTDQKNEFLNLRSNITKLEQKLQTEKKLLMSQIANNEKSANTKFDNQSIENLRLTNLINALKITHDNLTDYLGRENAKLLGRVSELESKTESNKNQVWKMVNETKGEISSFKLNIDATANEQRVASYNNSQDTIKILNLIQQIQTKMEFNQNHTIRSLNLQQGSSESILTAIRNQSLQITQLMKNVSELHRIVDTLELIRKESDMDKSKTFNPTQSDGEHNPQTIDHNILKEKLLKYLYEISGNKTISGVCIKPANSDRIDGVQIIHNITGVFPGVINTHIPSLSANVTVWKYFVSDIISKWLKGHLMLIHWSAENPLNSMDIFTDTKNATDAESRWTELIKDGGQLNKIWKEKLDTIAPYLKQLQMSGVIAILDILPKINYKTYIWRGRPGLNGTIKLYQLTHDYLTKHHNITSLIWNWSLHYNHMDQFEKYWPGKKYVDVASVWIWSRGELPISEYRRLISIVGNTPMSMENVYSVPKLNLLAAQPRWTWFTAADFRLNDNHFNDYESIRTAFDSANVINRGSINFFNDV